MSRARVLSFMSQWAAPRSPEPTPPSTPQMSSSAQLDSFAPSSPSSVTRDTSRARGDSKPARPLSMAYAAPQVDAATDTPPELQPIFNFLNSHGNKLYQEGYFLKLHDLDSRGRPSADRTWVECFAQLIGTVLSLWDAAALDAAGADGEVVPTFVNLSDASIKMIETLPMKGAQGGSLQNVLSISTAANNRYLLHFNSLNSLTQWTAGIRLAMYEHATLQEAYTGSLIAGKGRYLNNIKQIMERSKFAHEDWARVRFGAGTPWRRCWCVVSQPDEKEFNKAQKSLRKTSAYEKVKLPKGDIKFYDTRKVTKKTRPIATITDAYAAYAIYPQTKSLIDQSTLVKLEGLVTLETSSDSTAEGFVFVMPEVHPAVTGFEMMLRWLFPVYDTFGLYGRPNRLIADSLDQRGLMFAMPRERRYGYLDTLDVSSLIHTKGSQIWDERQWRREMKKLTGERMANRMESSGRTSRDISQRRAASGVRFGEGGPVRSSPGSRSGSPGKDGFIPRVDSAPPGETSPLPHQRSVSDAFAYKRRAETPSRLSHEATRRNDFSDDEMPPQPPRHFGALAAAPVSRRPLPGPLERIHSEPESVPTLSSERVPLLSAPAPVSTPPVMTHQPNSRPSTQPYQAPELRRAHSTVDAATLQEMQDAVQPSYDGGAAALEEQQAWAADVQYRQQNTVASAPAPSPLGISADRSQDLDARIFRESRPVLSGQSEPLTTSAAAHLLPAAPLAEQPDAVGARQGWPDARAQSRPGPPVPTHSSGSITRKALPRALPTAPAPTGSQSPTSPTAMDAWEGGVIDDAALERVLNFDSEQMAPQQRSEYSGTSDYLAPASNTTDQRRSRSVDDRARVPRGDLPYDSSRAAYHSGDPGPYYTARGRGPQNEGLDARSAGWYPPGNIDRGSSGIPSDEWAQQRVQHTQQTPSYGPPPAASASGAAAAAYGSAQERMAPGANNSPRPVSKLMKAAPDRASSASPMGRRTPSASRSQSRGPGSPWSPAQQARSGGYDSQSQQAGYLDSRSLPGHGQYGGAYGGGAGPQVPQHGQGPALRSDSSQGRRLQKRSQQ